MSGDLAGLSGVPPPLQVVVRPRHVLGEVPDQRVPHLPRPAVAGVDTLQRRAVARGGAVFADRHQGVEAVVEVVEIPPAVLAVEYPRQGPLRQTFRQLQRGLVARDAVQETGPVPKRARRVYDAEEWIVVSQRNALARLRRLVRIRRRVFTRTVPRLPQEPEPVLAPGQLQEPVYLPLGGLSPARVVVDLGQHRQGEQQTALAPHLGERTPPGKLRQGVRRAVGQAVVAEEAELRVEHAPVHLDILPAPRGQPADDQCLDELGGDVQVCVGEVIDGKHRGTPREFDIEAESEPLRGKPDVRQRVDCQAHPVRQVQRVRHRGLVAFASHGRSKWIVIEHLLKPPRLRCCRIIPRAGDEGCGYHGASHIFMPTPG